MFLLTKLAINTFMFIITPLGGKKLCGCYDSKRLLADALREKRTKSGPNWDQKNGPKLDLSGQRWIKLEKMTKNWLKIDQKLTENDD